MLLAVWNRAENIWKYIVEGWISLFFSLYFLQVLDWLKELDMEFCFHRLPFHTAREELLLSLFSISTTKFDKNKNESDPKTRANIREWEMIYCSRWIRWNEKGKKMLLKIQKVIFLKAKALDRKWRSFSEYFFQKK